MRRQKRLERFCCLMTALAVLIAGWTIWGKETGLITKASAYAYETRLFDTSYVHEVNIEYSDWEGFLTTCTNEEYINVDVTIDGERWNHVALRAKGNSSLSQVAQYGNNRYSFKIEFDRNDKNKTYHGLDKLCLNNLIQDNTLMKDYIAYTLMRKMGVPSPLCSYVWVTVNGEPWGLYLAVEAVEDSFLERNFDNAKANLYKPDSSQMGGGRGNGREFNFEDIQAQFGDFFSAEQDRFMAAADPTVTAEPTATPAVTEVPARSGRMAENGSSGMPVGETPENGSSGMPVGGMQRNGFNGMRASETPENGSSGMPVGGTPENGSNAMPVGETPENGSSGMPVGGMQQNGFNGMPDGETPENGSSGMPVGGMQQNGSNGMPVGGMR